MSTVSPGISSKPVLANHVPALETGFTPWDDLFSIFDSPVYPVSGLEKRNPSQIQNQSCSSPGLKDKPSGSTGVDERRKKRKLSNRESAQRSRMKKQKHLEDVRTELNQLKIENSELKNRLRYVLYHCQREKVENDRLRLEHRILQEKLLNLRQALVMRQIQQSSTWSCVNSTVVTPQQNPSILMRDHLI